MTLPAIPLPSRASLAGRKAIVTGASSGIGAAIAARLGAAGASVCVNFNSDRAGADRVADAVRAGGGEALVVKADVSVEREVERLFAKALAVFGDLDVLVANAGIQDDAAFTDLRLEQWRRVLDVNLTGAFLCARSAVRHFRARGDRPRSSRAAGNVVFVSSVHELIPWAGHVNYAASKGGLMQLMKSLAQEVAGERIRVNGIAPGAIRTPINRDAWEHPDDEGSLLELIPYGRVGDPEDVAEAAAWLVSDAADYVVGTTLFVDGGMSLYPAFREGG